MQRLKRKLRDVIRDSSYLYPVFLKLYLGKQLKLPSVDTDCHLTGFPRSANTYSHYLAKGLFPDLKFITHVHTIASLRSAKKFDIPVAIILRDPADCTVSMCLKNKKQSTDQAAIADYLYDYWHYHAWIEEHLPNAAIFRFTDVTQHSEDFLIELAKHLGIELLTDALPARVGAIKQTFADRESLKDPDGSSLPKESRKARKTEYISAIQQNAELASAEAIYQRLLLKVS